MKTVVKCLKSALPGLVWMCVLQMLFSVTTAAKVFPKPKVPQDLAHYFSFTNLKTRQLLQDYLPGVIPPADFAMSPGIPQVRPLGKSAAAVDPLPVPKIIEKAIEMADSALSGRSALRDTSKIASNRSSIAGIPNVFPHLPQPPLVEPKAIFSPPASPLATSLPVRPAVPEGGLGPLENLPLSPDRPKPQSHAADASSSAVDLETAELIPDSPFLPDSGLLKSQQKVATDTKTGEKVEKSPSPTPEPDIPIPEPPQQSGGLASQILRSLGLGQLADRIDYAELKSVIGLTPMDQQGGGLLKGTLYNILANHDPLQRTKLWKNNASSMLLGTNLALVQNLLNLPESPLCQPPPQPVNNFDVNAFLGRWYQVLYSPPLATGPCSMITYQKLTDIGNGGPGTIVDTFEYTRGNSVHDKPKIVSGYGVLRRSGLFAYRTTNSPTDVNMYVVHVGPLNAKGQYEYAAITINCNYPLYVLARDPVRYKSSYETEVNNFLEGRKLVTGWTKMLRLIAPVDYNLCTFPPTLFNS